MALSAQSLASRDHASSNGRHSSPGHSKFGGLQIHILDPAQPATKLFHAVNKMFSRDGHIFWVHPSRTQQAWEVVAGLLVFLKVLWEGIIPNNKFHKFFNDGMIE